MRLVGEHDARRQQREIHRREQALVLAPQHLGLADTGLRNDAFVTALGFVRLQVDELHERHALLGGAHLADVGDDALEVVEGVHVARSIAGAHGKLREPQPDFTRNVRRDFGDSDAMPEVLAARELAVTGGWCRLGHGRGVWTVKSRAFCRLYISQPRKINDLRDVSKTSSRCRTAPTNGR